MLDRVIRMPGEQPKPPADMPPASKPGIQLNRTVYQRDRTFDIVTQASNYEGCRRDHSGIVIGNPHCPPSAIETGGSVRFTVRCPTIGIELDMAPRSKRQRGAIILIACERLSEQIERPQDPVFLKRKVL